MNGSTRQLGMLEQTSVRRVMRPIQLCQIRCESLARRRQVSSSQESMLQCGVWRSSGVACLLRQVERAL